MHPWAMPTVPLRTCDLRSGDVTDQSFDNLQAALDWIAQRPRFVEVTGAPTEELSPEEVASLKAAMRPLDSEETEALRALDARRLKEVEAQEAARLAMSKLDEARARQEQAKADPSRPMKIRWTFNAGFSSAEPADTREISEEAKAAVLAWIAEREEWVRDRGQTIGEAVVTVYLGVVPVGRERIVEGGRFVPVMA